MVKVRANYGKIETSTDQEQKWVKVSKINFKVA